MTRNEKQDVNRRVKRHGFFLRTDWPVKLLFALVYIAGAILVWNSQDALRVAGENDMVSPVMKMALDNCVAAYLLLGGTMAPVCGTAQTGPSLGRVACRPGHFLSKPWAPARPWACCSVIAGVAWHVCVIG